MLNYSLKKEESHRFVKRYIEDNDKIVEYAKNIRSRGHSNAEAMMIIADKNTLLLLTSNGDVVEPDDKGNHQRPGSGTVDIRCGRPEETGQADVAAADTAQEQATHKRSPVDIVLTHGRGGQIGDHADTLFHQNLHFAGPLLDILTQKDKRSTQNHRNQEG